MIDAILRTTVQQVTRFQQVPVYRVARSLRYLSFLYIVTFHIGKIYISILPIKLARVDNI